MKGKAHASIGLLTYYNYTILSNTELTILGGAISLFFSLLPDLDHFNSVISKKLSNKKIESLVEALMMLVPLSTLLYLGYLKKFDYSILFFLGLILFISIKKKFKASIIRKLIISIFLILICILSYNLFKNIAIVKLLLFFILIPWFSHRTFSHSIFSAVILYFITNNLGFIIKNLNMIATLSYLSHIFLGDILTPQGIPLFWPLSKHRFKLNPFKGQSSVNIIENIVILLMVLLAFYLTFVSIKYKTPQQILLGSSIFNIS